MTADAVQTRPEAAEFLAEMIPACTERIREAKRRIVGSASPGAEADEEAIHDFRVAIRRLRSILRPLRQVYDKQRVKELSASLKEFADACGEIRDEEVLPETLLDLDVPTPHQEELKAWLEQRRQARERNLRRLARALASAGEGAKLQKTLRRLEKLTRKEPKRHWPVQALARLAMGHAYAEVAAFAEDLAPDSIDEMHLLRIRFKRLRYGAELMGDTIELSPVVAKRSTKMQKRLGHLHDLDEAARRVSRSRGISATLRAALLERIATARLETARVAYDELGTVLPEIRAALVDAREDRSAAS